MSKFTFQETGFIHRDAHEREHFFPFASSLKVRFQPVCNRVVVRSGRDAAVLEPAEQKSMLLEIFRRWSATDLNSAKKGAFDYAEDRRGFSKLVIAVCLLFAGPMAIALMNDSWKQATCTRVLSDAAAIQAGEVNITKVKKERKKQYILKLAFTGPDGKIYKGDERWLTTDENEANIPKTLPMVFAPAQPECWALTPAAGSTEINWAKRRYFSAVSGLFGVFFLVLTVYGLVWSISRLARMPPFREEVRGLFQF